MMTSGFSGAGQMKGMRVWNNHSINNICALENEILEKKCKACENTICFYDNKKNAMDNKETFSNDRVTTWTNWRNLDTCVPAKQYT